MVQQLDITLNPKMQGLGMWARDWQCLLLLYPSVPSPFHFPCAVFKKRKKSFLIFLFHFLLCSFMAKQTKPKGKIKKIKLFTQKVIMNLSCMASWIKDEWIKTYEWFSNLLFFFSFRSDSQKTQEHREHPQCLLKV